MSPELGARRLERALAALRRVEDGLLALLLGAMILLASAQIVLRNAFDAGIPWADPLLRAMVLWLGLLGALAASRGDKQISVDVLSRILPPRARSAVSALTCLFTTCVAGLVAWHGITLLQIDFETGTIAFASVPAWYVEAIIPLAFGLIALRYLLLSGSHIRALLQRSEAS